MGAEKIYTLFKYKVLDFCVDFCYTYGAAVSPAFAAGGTRCGHRPLRRTQGAGSADLHVAARRIGYYGLPHQPAGWFAMTIFWGCGAYRFAMTVFESTAGVVGASRTPPPTECGAGGRGRTPPLRGTWGCGASERLFSTFCKKIKKFSTMLLPFVQHRRRDLPINRIYFGKGELSL